MDSLRKKMGTSSFVPLCWLLLFAFVSGELAETAKLERPTHINQHLQHQLHQPQQYAWANVSNDSKNYTNHSVVKILERNIHLLFDSPVKNRSSSGEEEHEVLWFDNGDDTAAANSSSRYAFVRLSPQTSSRVKRDLHGHAGAPHFLTHNLQSWIDSEHYAATSEAARNFVHRRPTRDSHHHNRHSHDHNHHHHHHQPRYHRDLSLDDMDIAEEELDNVGTTYRDSGASASTVDELHNSRIVPSFVLNRYHPLSEVYKFLDDVESRTPGVTVFTIGHTHENRPIKAIEVLNRPSDPRFVWIDACTHAREWVTVTTSLYVLEQTILQKIPLNFIIVPVLNVDGYVYTWTKDRMWRKNRRPYEASRLSAHAMPDRCTGVDLNRNYDINFGGEGSSGNACSYLYQGPFPFSEPEVKAAAELLAKNRHRIKMTLSLHSFNQLWASPNAFTTARTADHAHHMRVLNAVGKAVQATNGVKYDVGPLGASLYLGSGFMMDWIYHKLGIRDAYLVELRDKGFHGFILPAEQIWPTATETWAGLRAAMKAIFGV